jgi:hypothetical protein
VEIHSEKGYKQAFSEENSKRQSKALECALDIRKFEIELYWKRASYFWTLIAASFAGFFALSTSDEPRPRMLIFLVSSIGLLLSLGWYLVNRGSKYWQENWERHVDLLETEIMGPLYKTTIAGEEFSALKFWGGYPYSVSKVNQLISLFVALTWCGLWAMSFSDVVGLWDVRRPAPWVLAAATCTFVVLLLTLGRGGSEGRPRSVNFRTSALRSSRDDLTKT